MVVGRRQPWGLTPDNAVLERHTVYRFQAHWVDRWRSGRVLIAGDAAHLMPPFAGQGMGAGLRDVFNLVWKLDLVLGGTAGEQLLDTYGPERSPHVRHFIDVSIGLGKVICVPGLEEATARDVELMAMIADPALAPAAPPPPRLGPGLLAPDDPQAGLLSIQSRVAYQGEEGLFDDVVGRGWFVLTTATAELALPPYAQRIFDRLDAQVLRVGPPGSEGIDVGDLDGRYAQWFTALGTDTVIVRPDFYVYAATDATGLAHVLEGLDSQLAVPRAECEGART